MALLCPYPAPYFSSKFLQKPDTERVFGDRIFGRREEASKSAVPLGQGAGGSIMRSTPSRKQLGISIQELLLVMAILTMAIVSIPNLNGFQRVLRARSAVNEIAATLNLARDLAVRSRTSHAFISTGADDTWQLRNLDTGKIVRHGTLPSGVTHTVLAAFQFDQDGRCLNPTIFSEGRPVTQYLQLEADLLSGQKVRYTLTLSPISRVSTTTEHFES